MQKIGDVGLKFNCVSYTNNHDIMSDKNCLDVLKNIIPRGSVAVIERESIFEIVANYIKAAPPFVTDARFTDEFGIEPAYIEVTPTRHVQDEKVWNFVYGRWRDMIKNLIGEHVGFITQWNFWPDTYPKLIPSNYNGSILERGNKLSAFFECTDELLAWNIDTGEFACPEIWSYGTELYILPRSKKHKMKEWIETVSYTKEFVEEFFSDLIAYFCVRYEGEGGWFVSSMLDSNAICARLKDDSSK